MQGLKQKQEGAVSLITVIFIAILLSVITLGFIRITVQEQRQSTDDDLSSRAFYAAEAGVDDARRDISRYMQGAIPASEVISDDCANFTPNSNPVLSDDTDLAISYTCQLVQLNVESYEDFIPEDGSSQIPLVARDAAGNAANFDRVQISWHITGTDLDDGSYNLRGGGGTADHTHLMTETNWNRAVHNFPAMLRTNFFSFAPGANRANIMANNFTTFLNPLEGGVGTVSLGATPTTPIVNADCEYVSGTYACTATITGFSSARQHWLRLKPLYRSTHVRISLFDGSVQRFMGDVQALVDVTGRANDVFRRIEVRVPLQNFNDLNILPDYVIESAEDVCKNFVVTDDPAEFDIYNTGVENGTTCNTSAP